MPYFSGPGKGSELVSHRVALALFSCLRFCIVRLNTSTAADATRTKIPMEIAATAPPLSPDVALDGATIALSVVPVGVADGVGKTETEGVGTAEVEVLEVAKDEVLEVIELVVVELFDKEVEVEEVELEVEMVERVEIKVSVRGAVKGSSVRVEVTAALG